MKNVILPIQSKDNISIDEVSEFTPIFVSCPNHNLIGMLIQTHTGWAFTNSNTIIVSKGKTRKNVITTILNIYPDYKFHIDVSIK